MLWISEYHTIEHWYLNTTQLIGDPHRLEKYMFGKIILVYGKCEESTLDGNEYEWWRRNLKNDLRVWNKEVFGDINRSKN